MLSTNSSSAAPSTLNTKSEKVGLIAINNNRLGDMAEQWIKLLCHWKGCEVFQNVGCTGPTDIVIIHPELGAVQIDVKCDVYGKHNPLAKPYWKQVHGHDIAAPIYVVRVTPDGDFSNWKASWRVKRDKTILCPPGWENFWDNDHRIYSNTSTKPNESA